MAKNRILYLITIIFMLAFVYLHGSTTSYIGLYVVLILPLVSLAFSVVINKRLIISEHLSSNEAIRGEKVVYRLVAKNRSLFPHSGIKAFFYTDYDSIKTSMPTDVFHFSVRAKEKREICCDLTCANRGVFEVGINKIVLYDTLGIFSFKQNVKQFQEITVYPKVTELTALPISIYEFESHQQSNSFSEDYSAISDLRQYTPSDSFRKIHWKASARKNEWVVKNFQKASKNATALIVDNSIMNYKPETALFKEDRMMDAYVSVLACCFNARYPIMLCYAGKDIAESGVDKSFNELFAEAVKIKFNSNGQFNVYMDSFINCSSDFLNIIAITQKLDGCICEQFINLKSFGANVIVINFSLDAEKIEENPYLNSLSEAGIIYYGIPENSGIENII